ncbi:GntR family transcriptional regulator [Rhodovibrionaceae bacterium A322]
MTVLAVTDVCCPTTEGLVIPQPKATAEEIYVTLRDRICLLSYPPGLILRETELAEEFGVSRTPLRAVLQRLAHGGLIESRDGVGTVVTDLDDQQVYDIYQMRLKIAEMIGSLAPHPLTSAHAQTADALRSRAAVITQSFDLQEYWQINHDLHGLISKIIGNQALRQMWDHFYFQAARIWYRHVRDNSEGVARALEAELQDVTRAMSENDPVALGYVQRNHIAYGFKRLQQAATESDRQ